MEDYYAILGVPKDARKEDIKAAYRRLASRHHPDKGGDTADFQKIEEAYRVLGDDASRYNYDNRNTRSMRGGFESPFTGVHINVGGDHGLFDINEIFAQFINGRRSAQQEQRKNRDIRITIDIPLCELMHAQKKVIQYTTSKGESSTVEINIPKGIPDNSTVRYPALGDNFFDTLPRGDLYVNIRHVNSNGFSKINETDLESELEIDCWQAMLGTVSQIKNLEGIDLNVKIPPGIQPGTRVNLKGQGLYLATDSVSRGNLYIVIKVFVPHFPDETRRKIEDFRKTI